MSRKSLTLSTPSCARQFFFRETGSVERQNGIYLQRYIVSSHSPEIAEMHQLWSSARQFAPIIALEKQWWTQAGMYTAVFCNLCKKYSSGLYKKNLSGFTRQRSFCGYFILSIVDITSFQKLFHCAVTRITNHAMISVTKWNIKQKTQEFLTPSDARSALF